MLIYLDHAATTPMCPEAVRAAVEAMTEEYGNPSARYALGTRSAAGLARGRAVVAEALGCRSGEVYFTSCGTEGDNWAIRGAAELGRRKGRHIVTTAIEHAAVLEPIKALEQRGYEVTRLQPDKQGRVDPGRVADALREDTVLVSVMLVNNELGTLLPVGEIARLVKEKNCPALVHTDGVQGFLKVPCSVEDLGVDLLTVSGHKVGGPKGVGALYVREGVNLPPLLLGGGQEAGLRSGTEATAQIAAFAAAIEVWQGDKTIADRIRMVKNYALDSLLSVPGLKIISAGDAPHILALSMPGLPSEMLVRELGDRGICVSSGSACHKGKPSHVFGALGLPKQERMGILRVSFGPYNTNSDADALVSALREIQITRIAVK